MGVTRHAVFDTLAAETDAATPQTAIVSSLAAKVDRNEDDVLSHLRALTACELAVRETETEFRISVTGEEFLTLDLNERVIVDPCPVSES